MQWTATNGPERDSLMCIVEIPFQADATASLHGILRLRKRRAPRATYSAQDDRLKKSQPLSEVEGVPSPSHLWKVKARRTKPMLTTIYNPRIVVFNMMIFLLRVLRAAGYAFLIAFLLHSSAHATDWSTNQLATKIVAVTGPGAVSLETTNRTSLSKAEFDQAAGTLRAQLQALGLQFVIAEQAAAAVGVTLSENLSNYVWVAEIRSGNNEPAIEMVSIPRQGALEASGQPNSILIHKALIWSQPERILDVAVIDASPTHMLVLDGTQVAMYGIRGGRWQLEQALPITHVRPWPRDLRGRLLLRKDHLFDAYLPAVFCHSTNSAPIALICSESDDPWPLGNEDTTLGGFFTPMRNYFTGALTPGIGKQRSAPPFYSAAALPRVQYTLWLFAAADGQLHLLDGMNDQTARLAWGSDIASVRNACGSGWNILATSTGSNGNNSDTVQAFDFPDRDAVAASQPVDFAGPITALWTETNGKAAIAVSNRAEAGEYEAYRLSFNCGQ
jgi:hypothetical protein